MNKMNKNEQNGVLTMVICEPFRLCIKKIPT